MKRISLYLAFAASLLLGCAGPMALTSEPKEAIQGTGEAPGKFMPSWPAEDKEELELAQRGLVGGWPLARADGADTWSRDVCASVGGHGRWSYDCGHTGLRLAAPEPAEPA
jgi:hypothetical protein